MHFTKAWVKTCHECEKFLYMYVQYASPFPLLYPSMSVPVCTVTRRQLLQLLRTRRPESNRTTGTTFSSPDSSSSQWWSSTSVSMMRLQNSVMFSTLYSGVQTDIFVVLRAFLCGTHLSAALCFPLFYQRSVICSGARCSLSLTLAASTATLFSERSSSEPQKTCLNQVHPELSWTGWPQLWGAKIQLYNSKYDQNVSEVMRVFRGNHVIPISP